MDRFFFRILYISVGNFLKWIYYGGEKTFEEVSKEDNSTLGATVTITLAILLFFSFYKG